MTDTIGDDNNNGIMRCNVNGEEYTFWTRADFVKSYIIDYLKNRFPGKLIIRELNQVDLSIPEENLPIEVQATPIRGNNNSPKYSQFEQLIEKQVKQNINDCGICYFFFDSELLKAMKSASRGISINMVWFRDYMKEGKLKVFTVDYGGVIEEKQYKDFDFLSEMSQTCKIAYETDGMILNRNKMKIFFNVVNKYGFTQNEIDKFYNDWREYCKSNKINGPDKNDIFMSFLQKQKCEKEKLYGKILHAISNLQSINNILGLKNYDVQAKSNASKLGIFDVDGVTKNATIRFTNKFNVCQYFPGYVRNKETWDKLKNHSLNPRQFESIVKNGIKNYFWYEDKGDIVTELEQIDDKGVNIMIESKDQIITVNIKDKDNLNCYKTKQGNIEDAWS